MSEHATDIKLLRAVIRVDHSMTLISKLLEAIQDAVRQLDQIEKHSEAHFKQLHQQLVARRDQAATLLRQQTIKTTAQC
ncbi:hypothetical protein MNEG_13015 [Monoraphidium neglectum]|uniref:Uncharacterized protein n=1 Tax=Monoraphidium neglectum TaxID=145388 RepID=A0A0D2KGI1_9CHLO|nr:hypothetical protein MNEG_13015 [Monoraphidium neglectum]KIY94948.1 hypothetical protein MNEG_13015 [Monoraphidium neglectum]|eukprot:XP_013893968.1 hypothetical protein MNEG_13015 [Monoraphidium neglectum]